MQYFVNAYFLVRRFVFRIFQFKVENILLLLQEKEEVVNLKAEEIEMAKKQASSYFLSPTKVPLLYFYTFVSVFRYRNSSIK